MLEFHQSSTAGLPFPKQNKFPDFSGIYSLIFAGKVLEMEYAVYDVDVDVVYGRRRMPLCPPPQYNTSK